MSKSIMIREKLILSEEDDYYNGRWVKKRCRYKDYCICMKKETDK